MWGLPIPRGRGRLLIICRSVWRRKRLRVQSPTISQLTSVDYTEVSLALEKIDDVITVCIPDRTAELVAFD